MQYSWNDEQEHFEKKFKTTTLTENICSTEKLNSLLKWLFEVL